MLQSLEDLDKQLKKVNSQLYILYGEPQKVLSKLVKKHNIKNIYMNKDYTPFADKREKQLQKLCEIEQPDDYLLFSPKSIVSGSGKAYRVYTPFLRKTEQIVKKPIKVSSSLTKKLAKIVYPEKKAWGILKKYSKYSPYYFPAGREEGLKRLKNLNTSQKNYDKCRDYLTYRTTNLSAYIKFGCISIREVWEAFNKIPGKSGKALKRQLMWREFYYHMYIDFPEKLEWSKNPPEAKLDNKAPDIVKACYNQLNKTGYLHNRGRMILANYLIHNQKEYWKSCDKMYATRLVDYDPLVNIGNWLTINRLPKFKVMKPEVQYRKFDKGCLKDGKDIPKGSYTEYFLNLK